MTQEKRARLFQQAQLALREGGFERAVAICRGLIDENPRDVPALHFLASIYGQMGRPDEAIATCRMILKFEPSSVQAWANLASGLRMRGAMLESQEVAR